MKQLFDRIAFWACLPIAGWQGLGVRKTALRLPPPPGDCHGICGQTPQNRFSKPLRLLALGDSIIAGIGADHQQQALPAQLAQALSRLTRLPVSWKAVGQSGANSTDLLDMLQQVQEPAPDLVLISIGVNDVTSLQSSGNWKSNLEQLMQRMGSRWPTALVVFAGLPPMGRFPLPPQPLRWCLGVRAAELDRIAAGLVDSQAAMLHIPILIDPAEHDFCADGFHPSGDAYIAWGTELAERLLPHFQSRQRSLAS